MRLPRLAIENHQFTIVLIVLLVLTGIVSFLTMPRSEDPQVAKSGASVIVIYPGASPKDMEQMVVDPIEEAANELDDIKLISSYMGDGLSVTAVEFQIGTDPDEKYSDVIQKINSIRNDLPRDIVDLNMIKWGVSDVHVLQLALVSEDAPYSLMEAEADRLKKKLERVSGVKLVETWAYPTQEVRVGIDLEKMAQLRIPLQQIMNAIQAANSNIPGGNIDIGSKRFNIETSGDYESLDEIRNTIVHSFGNKIVYLKDIAVVSLINEDQTYHARYDQQRAVYITVNQKEGTNIFDIMQGIRAQIAEFETQMPASMVLKTAFDQSVSVSDRISRFFSNLLQGIILVGLVIFLSLSFRASIIVMLAIPFSILIGIGFVDLSGYGIQQMSIAGLVIALGILVDNAIVVTENVSRFLQKGLSHQQAAIEGTNQISWAIISATATTVLAFIPIMMMRDVTGDFIRSMPVTVVYTLTASLLIALSVTPYLASRFLKTEHAGNSKKVQHLIRYIIENPYRQTLDYVLSHRKIVIIVTIIVFLVSLGLFPLIGISFFPKAEKAQLVINIDTPDGTSLDKTNSVAAYVESVLAAKKEVQHFAANIGRSNPRIYYNVIEKRERSTHAQIFVQLKEYDYDEMRRLTRELRQEFSTCPNAIIEVKELEQGPPVEAPIAIKILGENLDVLKNLSHEVQKIISSTSGTVNISNPLRTSKTNLHININRGKAGMLGVPLVEIDRSVRACIMGMPVSTYRDQSGKNYNIILRLPVGDKPRLSDFDKIYVASLSGAMIPLKQLATIEFKSSPMQINHYNLERSVTITADVTGGLSVDKVTKEIVSKLEKYPFPKGYRYYIGGELESREESFGGMQKAIIIAMLGIFGVLVLQFRSFTQPIIVYSAIPLALIGSIWALLITGYTFSFTAFIGLTSLVGIVVNNSIILVDYTNQLRHQGMDLIPALKESGETRFRPIILTTGTTIGGLLPLTLRGGTLWAPMGWTIIGGLLVSTFLTLVVVPVLYYLFESSTKKNIQ
ncbi:efflux RND transporter permease subunit [candidate division KSB1 bacterium]|nr:efflux RND transporter permease subunit [candidate division KSB1 bacterium]